MKKHVLNQLPKNHQYVMYFDVRDNQWKTGNFHAHHTDKGYFGKHMAIPGRDVYWWREPPKDPHKE